MFEKVFLINLPFRRDRLDQFRENYPKSLPPFEVHNAVHGDSIRHPDWWQSGSGAWGCHRSHLQILEKCYQEGIESYLVFEDDCIFTDDFDSRLKEFMAELPDDWQQIYLGGDLMHVQNYPPQRISPNVCIPRNVNRTHGFAVHKRGYEILYKHLFDQMVPGDHIDHHLGRLHDRSGINLYVPSRWMIGQAAGQSNINGRHNPEKFWRDPETLCVDNPFMKNSNRNIPAIFLEAPISIAQKLERCGWHRGHWQSPEGIDMGVKNAVESASLEGGLKQWHRLVVPEAIREGRQCVCLYHPDLTWEVVSKLKFTEFHRVIANTVDQAKSQLEAIQGTVPDDNAASLTRNLIYHIWPKSGNGTWQWNVAELLKRTDQFDGVRSIAVVTDSSTDSLDDVKAAFGDTRIDNWIHCENSPELGEVATFRKLLDTVAFDTLQRIASGKPNSITFYGHAKGATYDSFENHRTWTDLLYKSCLDHPDVVDRMIAISPAVGPFMREKPHWQPQEKTAKHYSGTFFWFDSKAVFANPSWSKIHDWRFGVEMWIGNFMTDQMSCIFGQDCGDLWTRGEWERWEREYEKFLKQHPKSSSPSTTEPTIAVIIPSLGRESLAGVVESVVWQTGDKDEIIIVFDGDAAMDKFEGSLQTLAFPDRVRSTSCRDKSSTYGNAQRNYGASLAKADLLWFIDDDDTVDANAVATIKKAMIKNRSPRMFKMNHLGTVRPEAPEIKAGNVGGPILVVPNVPDLPLFPVPAVDAKLSDFEWVSAVNSWKTVKFDEAVIYSVATVGGGD